jgi:hypothetical protein
MNDSQAKPPPKKQKTGLELAQELGRVLGRLEIKRRLLGLPGVKGADAWTGLGSARSAAATFEVFFADEHGRFSLASRRLSRTYLVSEKDDMLAAVQAALDSFGEQVRGQDA